MSAESVAEFFRMVILDAVNGVSGFFAEIAWSQMFQPAISQECFA